MSEFTDFFNNFWSTEYFGNTGQTYLISLALLLFYMVVIYGSKLTIIKRINQYMDRTEEVERIEIIMENVGEFIDLKFSIFVSLYLSTLDLVFPEQLQRIIDFVIFFLLSWVIIKSTFKFIESLSKYQIERNAESKHLVEFFKLIVKMVVFVVTVLWFLYSIGINITAYVASMSVVGLAIAFALQNIIADLFASIILYFDKPFEIGDTIKVGSDAGKVEKIGIRSTHLRTGTGNLLVIPNRDLSSKRINNMKDMRERRVSQIIHVSPTTPLPKLKKIPFHVEKIVSKVHNSRFLRTFFTKMGTYSFEFEMVYYITCSNYNHYLEAKQEINFKILEMLKKQNIMIPYPTQTIILEKSDILEKIDK